MIHTIEIAAFKSAIKFESIGSIILKINNKRTVYTQFSLLSIHNKSGSIW